MFLFSLQSWRFACLALLVVALPAAAQPQSSEPRVLPVPADTSWQHAETGLILRPQSAGLRRSRINDTTADELDIVAHYADGQSDLTATVYLFKTAVPSAPLWFDRALTSIAQRPGWGLEAMPAPAATAFAPPGATTPSGLRASIDVGIPGVRSTAVAIAPLGQFMIKIRLSSTTRDRAALEELMTGFMAGIGWPSPAAAEPEARVVEACRNPLRLRRARLVRDSGGEVLATLVGAMAMSRSEGPPPVYCREPGASLQYGVYRAGSSRDAYLIALADSGIVLSVGAALDLSALLGEGGAGGRRYSMTLLGREMTSALPSFNRLPPPDQALAVAFADNGPVISMSTEDPPER